MSKIKSCRRVFKVFGVDWQVCCAVASTGELILVLMYPPSYYISLRVSLYLIKESGESGHCEKTLQAKVIN